METYRNQVMLIVHTASHCQFTYQYEDLQKLYEKYHNQDFTILSSPCNQFGEQNPEDGHAHNASFNLEWLILYLIK